MTAYNLVPVHTITHGVKETKDDLKAIVDTISPLVDARVKTTETLIKGEIKASEERVKEELRAEAKATTFTLDAKLVKRVNSHETRIDELEKEVGIPNPHKH
jgi:F0F1-type ATP synthase membrane subunit b/b'